MLNPFFGSGSTSYTWIANCFPGGGGRSEAGHKKIRHENGSRFSLETPVTCIKTRVAVDCSRIQIEVNEHASTLYIFSFHWRNKTVNGLY